MSRTHTQYISSSQQHILKTHRKHIQHIKSKQKRMIIQYIYIYILVFYFQTRSTSSCFPFTHHKRDISHFLGVAFPLCYPRCYPVVAFPGGAGHHGRQVFCRLQLTLEGCATNTEPNTYRKISHDLFLEVFWFQFFPHHRPGT